MSSTPLHFEVLTPEARALWPLLPACTEGYYLAGGTALALQLNHRRSADFDFFIGSHIPRTQLKRSEAAFNGRTITPVISSRDELTLLVDGVKCSFISYPFPVLAPFVKEQDINLLSAPEIAATKAYTIGRRGEWKDYVDLCACLTGNITTLSAVIETARKKYGAGFNDRLFLEQLVYLEDVDDMQGLEVNIPLTRDAVRGYFKKAIADLRLAA